MNIWPIALSSFKESIRQKILYVIVIFSFIIVLSALLYKTLAINQEVKLMKDVGLAAMTVLGMLMAIFTGTSSISHEIDTKTIHTLLAKPVKRSEFILGKFLGAGLTTLFNVAVMAVGFLAIVGLVEKASPFYLLSAIILIAFELLILISAAIFFSTIMSQTFATIFTILLFLIGHVTALFPYLIHKAESLGTKIMASIFYYLLPNLQYFNLRGEAVSRLPIPLSLVGLTIVYGLLYTAIGLVLSILIIRGRDFS